MLVRLPGQVHAILQDALRLSKEQGHGHLGVEHVFNAMLRRGIALSDAFRQQHGAILQQVAREVERTAWENGACPEHAALGHTPRCMAALRQATELAERWRHGTPGEAHLLLAILMDDLAAPSRVMDAMGHDRTACVAMLFGELSAKPATGTTPPTDNTDTANVLSRLPVHDLTALARAGKLMPAIGRDTETAEIVQVLSRKNKNSVMLVGEAGVGKTQIVNGLACDIVAGKQYKAITPAFDILELDVTAMTHHTQYRATAEANMLQLVEYIKGKPDTVLFVDNAHLGMGAAPTDANVPGITNVLEPILSHGEIRCIGATTTQEYRKLVVMHPELENQFQMIRVNELSGEDTTAVVRQMLAALQKYHRVHIAPQCVEAAISLAQRHLPHHCLPDSAIDVLDRACARSRLRQTAHATSQHQQNEPSSASATATVTPQDIRMTVSQMVAVPVDSMIHEDRIHLGGVEQMIKKRLIGQDQAIAKTIAAIKHSTTNAAASNRPDAILLFLGPPGVGKKHLAGLLAEHLFGSTNHLVSFDMTSFAGEQEMLAAIMETPPFSVVLFDAIEAAHTEAFESLLPLFTKGRPGDSNDLEISLKHCIIVLVSNVGADILCNADERNPQSSLIKLLRTHFPPECITLFDAVVPFHPLLDEDVRSILRLEVNKFRAQLREKRIRLRMYQRAYEHLIEKSCCDEYGVRELPHVVNTEVIVPIGELLLNNTFGPDDVINVMENEGCLTFVRGRVDDDEARRWRREES